MTVLRRKAILTLSETQKTDCALPHIKSAFPAASHPPDATQGGPLQPVHIGLFSLVRPTVYAKLKGDLPRIWGTPLACCEKDVFCRNVEENCQIPTIALVNNKEI
jgi:hypothetical protein